METALCPPSAVPDASSVQGLFEPRRSDLVALPRLPTRPAPSRSAPAQPHGVVGRSAALRRVLDEVRHVAATDSTVLLLGETGSGKELFATQVHEGGARRSRPMVKVNCAAIPETLIESELFGREKGAFTGALAKQ